MVASARRVSAFVLLFLLSFSLAAQKAPALGETLEISLVNVDVFVTDRDGNRVHGLTQDDFEIFENGKRQPVSNFSEFRGPAANDASAPESAAAETAPRERRTILLFIEQTRLPKWSADRTIDALKETLRNAAGPGDAVSVVLWNRNNIVHTEFTGDMRVIEGALDRIARIAVQGEIDVAEQQREELADVEAFEDGIAAMSRARASRPRDRAAGGQASPLATDPADGSAVNLYMMIAYNEMQVRVAAINSAIDSMSGFDGKKIMILATKRLGEIAGAEYAYATGLRLIEDQLKHRFSTTHLTDSIISNANASGITIYPVNLPGMDTSMNDPGQVIAQLTLTNETVSLDNIAKKTGGLTASGSVDIAKLLPRVADDANDYYSLAYRVPSSGTDFTRNIEVKTRNRAYTVRARRQFVEKSEETRMRDRLRATLFHAGSGSDVEIIATAGAIKKVRGVPTLPVTVKIPIGDLTLLPQGEGKHSGKFSVWVAAASDLDELSDVSHQAQPFEIRDEQLKQANAGYFTYDVDVTVGRKAKYVAVGVLDEVGRTYGLARLQVGPEQKVQ